jgi:hypothetical protein
MYNEKMKNVFRVICFLFNEKKLPILEKVVLQHNNWNGYRCDIAITTNTGDETDLSRLNELTCKYQNGRITIYSIPSLSNNWLLPWAHKPIMYEKFLSNEYQLYIYSEDDILISGENLRFYEFHRKELAAKRLYPMLPRVEWSAARSTWVLTDITEPLNQSQLNKIDDLQGDYEYCCPNNPYQAMFIYDHELMQEHVGSHTFDILKFGNVHAIDSNPDHPGGGVAERAAFGITFESLEPPLTSRCVVPVLKHYWELDRRGMVHHLGDAYAGNHHKFGVIALSEAVLRQNAP